MIPAALAGALAEAERAAPERAVDLLRPFLFDIGWFNVMLADELKRMADDPGHLPSARTSRRAGVRHLQLCRTERIWMTATVIDGRAPVERQLTFSGRITLTRPLTGALRGVLYRREAGRAEAVGEVDWPARSVILLDERRDTLLVSPSSERQTLLRVQIAPPGPVRAFVHDHDGGQAAVLDRDEQHARTLMMLSLLRLQGRRDAADHFVRALDAPLPAQRWAVMREYLALDTASAAPLLQIMADDDPDDAVRSLAARTLVQIEGALCHA